MRAPLSAGLAHAVFLSCALLTSGCTHSAPSSQGRDMLSALADRQAGQDFAARRKAMVDAIRADVRDADPAADTPALERALAVVNALHREDFVGSAGRKAAYVDLPQSIGYGQTISDPYVVSIMTAALDLPADASVLDVGTGSGYQAAVLSRLARHVSSIEIVAPLARTAAARLKRLGFSNVEVRSGDGFLGWPEHAPFDGIVVAASATAVPAPLLAQLKPGARLVMPIGASDASTQLLRITKRADGSVERCSLGPALFVPLTGGRSAPFLPAALRDRSIPWCFRKPIVDIF